MSSMICHVWGNVKTHVSYVKHIVFQVLHQRKCYKTNLVGNILILLLVLHFNYTTSYMFGMHVT